MGRYINRIFLTVFLVSGAMLARGQDALSAFTNRADQLLRHSYGFGVNEIPIYCSTNPLVRYNGAIHYLLQQAVNDYDQTNHTDGDFDFPSVFRPQFSLATNDQSVRATISNWVEVTNEYAAITARPFKAANDPTLSIDDNVWGIGLIVGAKPAVPNFNEFSYQNAFNISRKLLFYRTDPDTRPYATNQFYEFSLSNIFGCSSVNTWTQALPRDVTLYFTNLAVVSLTNELSGGITNSFTNGGTQIVLSNGWRTGPVRFSYKTFANSALALPLSTYLEHSNQFVLSTNFGPEFVPGFPVHSWVVSTTNQFLYALVDNESGRILDFVCTGPFGSSRDLTQALLSDPPLSTSLFNLLWATNGADTSLFSPPSDGVLNQIQIGMGTIAVPASVWIQVPTSSIAAEISQFVARLNGTDIGDTVNTFECPFVASTSLYDAQSWWTDSFPPYFDFDTGMLIVAPAYRCTIDEMGHTGPGAVEKAMPNGSGSSSFNPIGHTAGTQPIQITNFTVTSNQITLYFQTGDDKQYGIWSSNDLINWTFLGVAEQLENFRYTFVTPLSVASTASYFQARKL